VLVNVVAVHVMQMAIMQVIHVPLVFDALVTAATAVSMAVSRMRTMFFWHRNKVA
jgi:hypothetical protein